MSDPYKVLGVSPSATEDEIKKAYRELIKKYHPDNYSGSPLEDLASEKMKEVNEAYDEIMKQRKTGGRAYKNSSYGASAGSNYNDVRNFIRNNRIADAEQILEGVPTSNRDAEWYFLRGTIYYKKGWTEEAYRNFTTAHTMSPDNAEYASVLNQMNSRRRGNMGGYQQNSPNGCTGCDVCSGLLCADCCCECLGGDLIRCC